MAKFMLLAGLHHYGSAKHGNRVTVNPNETFDTDSEKEIEFCRKYPDRYQEVKTGEFNKPINKERVTMDKKPNTAPGKKDNTDSGAVEVDMDKLQKMDERSLLLFCKANDIDVKNATKKEDILKAIKAATTEE